ncbi:MAG: TetR family transcriptional regulator C-terminal domain-containing protein [Actinobacteria bacterium]|nr:TetR family transcriptional regulator C-terminal domain-containing protein [Actinomycetota bacterium]
MNALLTANAVAAVASIGFAGLGAVRPAALSGSAPPAGGERFYGWLYAARGIPLGVAAAVARLLLANYVNPARDPVALLWLDAWQASRRRPALHDEVARQMNHDLDRLSELIAAGQRAGEFGPGDSRALAMRILALVDGLSVQAAIRDAFDYADVQRMLWRNVERELGLPAEALRGR